MIKTLITTALFAAATAIAQAQPLPAPPSVKYTAPDAVPCHAQTLQVYFPAGETAMTAASQAMLAQVQETLDGCIIGPVSIQAIAADAPTLKTADRVAEARLAAVTSALKHYRLTGQTMTADVTEIEAFIFGSGGAATDKAGGHGALVLYPGDEFLWHNQYNTNNHHWDARQYAPIECQYFQKMGQF